MEILGGAGPGRDPEAALEWLAARARIAVVTLGERGCIVRAESQVPEVFPSARFKSRAIFG